MENIMKLKTFAIISILTVSTLFMIIGAQSVDQGKELIGIIMSVIGLVGFAAVVPMTND